MCCRQGSSKPPALSLEFTVIRIMSLPGRDLRHGYREPSRQGGLALRAGILTRSYLLPNRRHCLALIRRKIPDGNDQAMSS
jgi:hypothetical protein